MTDLKHIKGESATAPHQFEQLHQLLRSIKRHPKGYQAVYCHFSRLDRQHKQPKNRRDIATAFNNLIQRTDAYLFWLKNFDCIFICKSIASAEIDQALVRAKRAVNSSSVLKSLILKGEDDSLVDWYELATHYTAFRSYIEQQHQYLTSDGASPSPRNSLISRVQSHQQANKPQTTRQEDKADELNAPTQDQDLPSITLSHHEDHDALIQKLLNSPISPYILNDPAYIITAASQPQMIYTATSIDLTQMLNISTLGEDRIVPPLIQDYLKQLLEPKLLDQLLKSDQQDEKLCNLNLTLKTILSENFATFMQHYQAHHSMPIIIEIDIVDLFRHYKKFNQARAIIASYNGKLCLDCHNLNSYSSLNTAHINANFYKISAPLPPLPPSQNIPPFNQPNIILNHCDQLDHVEAGQEYGIHIFQGSYIRKRFT